MIETRPMTKDDFLIVMDANSEHYPEFAALDMEKKLHLGWLNSQCGTAESFYMDGKLIGIGGVRYIGLGEAWMACMPEMKTEKKLTLLKESRNYIIETKHELKLWRIFAESKISKNFLKHLDFEPADMLVLSRL